MSHPLITSTIERLGPPGHASAVPTPHTSSPGAALAGTATLAVGLVCLTTGIAGMLIPYPHPKLPDKERPPVTTENVRVQLMDANVSLDSASAAEPTSLAPPLTVRQQSVAEPPSPTQAVAPPDAPALAELAIPNPVAAFKQLIESSRMDKTPPASARLPQPEAQRSGPIGNSAPPPHALQHLVLGIGEGAQPNPEYPRASVLAHQEGTVHVKFTIGDDGKVIAANLAPGSRWPLLNQAALRMIRERWRFQPGLVRYRDISIDFQLKEQ